MDPWEGCAGSRGVWHHLLFHVPHAPLLFAESQIDIAKLIPGALSLANTGPWKTPLPMVHEASPNGEEGFARPFSTACRKALERMAA